MSSLKVEYQQNSISPDFALAGDEVSVTKSNVDTVEKDLDNNNIKEPGPLKEKIIHQWAKEVGSSDDTEYNTEGEEGELSDENDESNGVPSEKSQNIAAATALAITDFGAICMGNALTRLAILGAPMTGAATGLAETIEGAISLGTAAMFDINILDRMDASSSLGDVLSEFDMDNGILMDDINSMIEMLEAEDEAAAATTAEPPAEPPAESVVPEEVVEDPEAEAAAEENAALAGSVEDNKNQIQAVLDENAEKAEFMQQGKVFGSLALTNAAMLGATTALNQVMSAKASGAAIAYHSVAASLLSLPFPLEALAAYYEACALDQTAGAGKLVTAAGLFAGATSIMATTAAAEFGTAESGEELGARVGELQEIMDTHDETTESFMSQLTGGDSGGSSSAPAATTTTTTTTTSAGSGGGGSSGGGGGAA